MNAVGIFIFSSETVECRCWLAAKLELMQFNVKSYSLEIKGISVKQKNMGNDVIVFLQILMSTFFM